MAAELSNPLLQQSQDKIEANLAADPQNQQNYEKIVVAGMHAALDGGPNSILAQLQQSHDPISDAAKGAVSLVLILRKQAQGVMPLKAMVPAAMTLMLKALDFADRAGIVKVDNPALVRATHIFTDFVFARFGITREGLANAAQKIHALIQDPAARHAMALKAGTAVHPGAAPVTPTAPAPAAAPPAPSGSLLNG